MNSISLDWNNIRNYIDVNNKYLFIDSINVISGKESTGRKMVSSQDWYFKMHFPGNPVMPGIMVMESIKQTAIVTMTVAEQRHINRMIMLSCKNMRMHNSVRPGDVLCTHVQLVEKKNDIYYFSGEAYVERLLIKDQIKICTMEFGLCFEDAFESRINNIECSYTDVNMTDDVVLFGWQNFDDYIADPIEYRFIDNVQVFNSSARGMKCLSFQDWYFELYDMEKPYMPLGFLMEAIMQTGVLCVTSKEKRKDNLMMFQACRNLEVFALVRPGNCLRTNVELISYKRGLANYRGVARVDEKVVCSMEFMLLVPNEIIKIEGDNH